MYLEMITTTFLIQQLLRILSDLLPDWLMNLLTSTFLVQQPKHQRQKQQHQRKWSNQMSSLSSSKKRNVTSVTKKVVAANQKWRCGLCHQLLDETYEVDHVIPLYLGGTNDISNLMALDPICHKKKTLKQYM